MRCPTCPAPPRYCAAEALAAPRLCELPHYREWLATGQPPTPAPPREPVLLSAEESARLRAAERCIHRAAPDCGCRGVRCELSREVVTIADCLACVDSAL